MLSMTKRPLLIAVLVVVTLAAVACDSILPNLTVSNFTSETVSISVFEDDYERPTGMLFIEGEFPFKDSLDVASGETREIHFDSVEPHRDYVIHIKVSLGDELLERTFSNRTLAFLDWKLKITPEGIQ